MYLIRRQGANFKVQGRNENFLKRTVLDVPEGLKDQLPNQGIRLALRYPTGFYNGMMPPMVSVYLVPRNGSKTKKTLIETLIITQSGNREEQREGYTRPITKEDVKSIVCWMQELELEDVLKDYLEYDE